MLTAVVVLPVPPLWLKTAMRRGSREPDGSAVRSTGAPPEKTGLAGAVVDAGTAGTVGAVGAVAGIGSPSLAPLASARICSRHSSLHA